jgi:hypothetical protein
MTPAKEGAALEYVPWLFTVLGGLNTFSVKAHFAMSPQPSISVKIECGARCASVRARAYEGKRMTLAVVDARAERGDVCRPVSSLSPWEINDILAVNQGEGNERQGRITGIIAGCIPALA